MDRFDAVVAAELVGADQIIPCHYGTFPPIETDVQAFKSDVEHAGYAQVVILEPGESHTP
jgi:L-ascorbate metabolism protein UlaG (beta-lactamase superfamily)